jgi:phosphoribosylformimino-5-aminoimidazole carboxamide ribotide isomerase
MKLFPAIDLYGGKAVRLYKGDYEKMTVYSENPKAVAESFKAAGAEYIHLVDLEGAKLGGTPAYEIVKDIVESTGLFVEIGGGIRSMPVIEKYIEAGVGRVILGTAAVTDEALLREAAERFGEKIAVGVDIKDGLVAIKGWVEKTELEAFAFCERLEKIGIETVICTDISKDGAMMGTNRELYRKLGEEFNLKIIASGGVSSIDDIKALKEIGAWGAIIGKAYYTGAIDLAEALKVAR